MLQESINLNETARETEEKAPSLLAIGRREIHMVAEGEVLFKIEKLHEVPYLLLAAYYSFNMKYPKGLNGMYTLLEYMILGKPPAKMYVGLSQFITFIDNA